MRNALILGSGRSGTSMAAGSLAKAGYFMGETLYPARAANPKGFFEDPGINGINEALLAPVAGPIPRAGNRWLALLPPTATVQATPAIISQIQEAVSHQPWCFKDPRLCYTLPAWQPFIGDAGILCIFRHPQITAHSIGEEVKRSAVLQKETLDRAWALQVWAAMYQRLLQMPDSKNWLFIHYDQLLVAEGQERLSEFFEVRIDSSFPDPHLRRPSPPEPLSPELERIYQELCQRAHYQPETRSQPRPQPPQITVACLLDGPNPGPLLDHIAEQRGIQAEVLLVDRHHDAPLQTLAHPQFPVHRLGVTGSRGQTLRAIAKVAQTPYIALLDPQGSMLPARLAHLAAAFVANAEAQAQAQAEADAVCSDYYIESNQHFLKRLSAQNVGGTGTFAFHRDLLAQAELAPGAPVERLLWAQAKAPQTLAEPLSTLPVNVFFERAQTESSLWTTGHIAQLHIQGEQQFGKTWDLWNQQGPLPRQLFVPAGSRPAPGCIAALNQGAADALLFGSAQAPALPQQGPIYALDLLLPRLYPADLNRSIPQEWPLLPDAFIAALPLHASPEPRAWKGPLSFVPEARFILPRRSLDEFRAATQAQARRHPQVLRQPLPIENPEWLVPFQQDLRPHVEQANPALQGLLNQLVPILQHLLGISIQKGWAEAVR